MARTFRRVWRNDPEIAALGDAAPAGHASMGELVEAWAWASPYQACVKLARRMEDMVDAEVFPDLVRGQKLWLCVLRDRLEYGDRL